MVLNKKMVEIHKSNAPFQQYRRKPSGIDKNRIVDFDQFISFNLQRMENIEDKEIPHNLFTSVRCESLY